MPKISQLPVATTILTTDLFAIVQAGTTKQATGSLVATMVQTGLVITIPQVTGLSTALAACLQVSNNLSDVASKATSRINLGLPALTNGQLWIGSTGVDPAPATITPGTNISVSNGAGTITIAATGLAGIGWVNVTSGTQAMVADTGYVADKSTLVTFTLPVTAAFGTVQYVVGLGSGGWQIDTNAGQNIQIGSGNATSSVASTNQYDTIHLVCVTADTTWCVVSAPQTAGLTIV